MNPFSVKFKALRESRGLLQKTLAIDLEVSPTYLSAIEKGRKPPPSNDRFYSKLTLKLGLTPDEVNGLRSHANSESLFRGLFEGTSPQQVEIAMLFAERLRSLHPAQLRALQAILTIDLVPLKKG